jgi:VWFA-related protein
MPSFIFAQEPVQALPDGAFIIRARANLVVLHASVRDHKSLPVSGLAKENFQVFEQGIRQEIKQFSSEDIPVTVGLVIDNSGSMRTKRPDVIAAALAFARSSNPRDQMFVVNFNEKVSFALPDGIPFTDNVGQLSAALARVGANGETALYDAVHTALAHLSQADRDKKVLIIISDGGDNASKHTLDSVLAEAKRSDAIIYCIGLFDDADKDRNPGVLKRFAEATGGELFLPGEIKDVVSICVRIARDLRSQYTLAYVPSISSDDGMYRLVEVRVGTPSHQRLSVRTRSGYFASPTPPETGGVSHGQH